MPAKRAKRTKGGSKARKRSTKKATAKRKSPKRRKKILGIFG